MKGLIYLLVITIFLSCNNERVLELPEIENAEITEVLDVSPAYIFYDETQPDSTLFNRKNLIGTTNWLVNVDKRLTLKQAIPHIQYLQDKRKKASMHKNEAAKNYFTCNDTSIKNLGFLEFTDVNYNEIELSNFWIRVRHLWSDNSIALTFKSLNEIKVDYNIEKNHSYNIMDMNKALKFINKNSTNYTIKLFLNFNHCISFQNYILIKSELQKIESDKIIIESNEFIY